MIAPMIHTCVLPMVMPLPVGSIDVDLVWWSGWMTVSSWSARASDPGRPTEREVVVAAADAVRLGRGLLVVILVLVDTVHGLEVE